MSKYLAFIKDTISQLPINDQIKTYYAVINGFPLFYKYCQKYSETNWAYFSTNLINQACLLTDLTEKEAKILKTFDLIEYPQLGNYETLSVVPGFQKKSLQPFTFIARHSDPKGLF